MLRAAREGVMSSHPRFISFGLGFFLAAAAHAQVNPKNMDTTANPRGQNTTGASGVGFPGPSSAGSYGPAHPQLYRLWKGLAGRYEAAAGDLSLTLTVRPIYPYSLFVETRTKEGGVETVERGYLFLVDASPSYTSSNIRYAVAYRPDSTRSDYSCLLYGRPSPGGITFESEQTDCSFTLGRRVAKLRLDATDHSIALSPGQDGETTVLHRIADE
jgi:hypothetical protein